jgi:hypothetical protein
MEPEHLTPRRGTFRSRRWNVAALRLLLLRTAARPRYKGTLLAVLSSEPSGVLGGGSLRSLGSDGGARSRGRSNGLAGC